MATAHDDPDGQDTSPYLRVPWPLAALGILVVLGVFLGFGLWATQARRAATASTAHTTAVPTEPHPLRSELAAATQQPLSLAAEAVTSTATAFISDSRPAPAVAATPLAHAERPPPSETVARTPRPTIQPDLATEIAMAYKHYWDVRARALLDLNPELLTDVMAGDHLDAVDELIGELREENRAVETSIQHQYAIVSASPEQAEIVDTYADSSVYVDVTTGEVTQRSTIDTLKELYTMQEIDGMWKVVSLVRAPQ